MIRRDFDAARGREFDLLVIGGGIYGVALLREAAVRGLSACLCEAGDFGGGTSWNSLRIAHGGLRYLQTGDLPRFFQSVAARRSFARRFPQLVRPLECVMPLYGRGLRRTSVLRVALFANDMLSSGRNGGLSEGTRIPGGRIIDPATTRRRFPGVPGDLLEGAACWSDYRMVSSERILMELLRDGCRRGAVALNYAPVAELVQEGGVVRGGIVLDSPTNERNTIAARTVVNCAGPWVRSMVQGRGGDLDALFRPSLAFNLLLDRAPPGDGALAVSAPGSDSPVLFLLPQDDGLLAGTMHVARPVDCTDALPAEGEISDFLDTLNLAIPGLAVRPEHVRRVFAGLLPVAEAGTTILARREVILDHGRRGGLRRLYSVSGIKWTTATAVAGKTLDLLGISGAGDENVVPLSQATGLLTDVRQLWSADTATLALHLRQVIAEESVVQADDLVLRRTNWATTASDLDSVRSRVAQLVARGAGETP